MKVFNIQSMVLSGGGGHVLSYFTHSNANFITEDEIFNIDVFEKVSNLVGPYIKIYKHIILNII